MNGALWYVGRGAGTVSLVLLSTTVVLGVQTWTARALPGLPRFAVAALHRSVGLLSVVFVAVHVVTLRLDPYAELSWLDVVVPFTAAVRPLGYGLGAVALDLMTAVVVTSLLRHRLTPRGWRAIHHTSYPLWAVAVIHVLLSGTDMTAVWLLATVVATAAAVIVAAGRRWLGPVDATPDRGPASGHRRPHPGRLP